MANSDDDRVRDGVLGDIDPRTENEQGSASGSSGAGSENGDAEESMAGGSQHDRTKHSGSRDVTEGTTGGTESGGTRNYRQGSGAVGVDIGNRPE
jgi:hypothetical protein